MKIHTRLLALCMSLICSAVTFALPVDDITLVSVSPKPGEVDMDLRTLQNITLMFSQEVQVGSKALVTLEMPDGQNLEAVPVVSRFAKKNCTVEFPDFVPYNGTYKLTIKRWSVGDAEWIANREEGHSNPKIEVEWTIVNGLVLGVDYDLAPVSLTPANETQFSYFSGVKLASIQIVFPNGTILNPETKISLSCTEARYEQPLTFWGVKGGKNTTFTAYVSPVPTTSGNYTLMIPGGAFGDGDFINGDGGHANLPIDYLYVVSGAENGEGDMLETVYQTFEPVATYLTADDDGYTLYLEWSSMPEVDETYLSRCMVIDEYGLVVPDAIPSLVRKGVKAIDEEPEFVSEFRLSADLQADKQYTILIPPYIFGDARWVESNHDLGTTNPQIKFSFYPENYTVGIDRLDSESTTVGRPNDVYSVTGILLHPNATEAEISTLPKGFYIIGGRKRIVR